MSTSNRPVALITGASRGIGEATAHELAARGYTLVLAARSTDALARLAGRLSQRGSPALPIPTDMQQPEQVRRLARLALEHFGRVDVLVNNAGVGELDRPFAQLERRQIDQVLAVNLLGPVTLTHALLPQMLARRSGAVIFIGSVAGQIGLPGSTPYSASKFGLRGFAHALRREVGHRGINVTLLAPGFIATDMTARLRDTPVPMPGPDLIARAIADSIDLPRREWIIPGFYSVLIKLEQLLPGVADRVLRFRLGRS